MLKRIVLSTLGVAVLAIGTIAARPLLPAFGDPPPDCFPYTCPTPNDPPDTQK